MERALCLAELGCHTGDEALLREAIGVYAAIDRDLEAAGNPEPLTKYRLGRAYASNEDPEAALDCYEEGYELLKQGRWSLAKPDWLRITLPRSLGDTYWRLADELRARARKHGNEKYFKRKERRDHMARAVAVTRSAFAEAKALEGALGNAAEIEAEFEILMNNLLSIALEHVELHDGDWTSLASFGGDDAGQSLTREELDALAQQLSDAIGQHVANRHNRLNTLRLYRKMTGDAAMERHFAERTLSSLEDLIERGFELKNADCRMVEDALRSLGPEARNANPTPALRAACPCIRELLA
jgi:hypothetical protein